MITLKLLFRHYHWYIPMEPMHQIHLNAALLVKKAEASILVCVIPCNQHNNSSCFCHILTPSIPEGIVVEVAG